MTPSSEIAEKILILVKNYRDINGEEWAVLLPQITQAIDQARKAAVEEAEKKFYIDGKDTQWAKDASKEAFLRCAEIAETCNDPEDRHNHQICEQIASEIRAEAGE